MLSKIITSKRIIFSLHSKNTQKLLKIQKKNFSTIKTLKLNTNRMFLKTLKKIPKILPKKDSEKIPKKTQKNSKIQNSNSNQKFPKTDPKKNLKLLIKLKKRNFSQMPDASVPITNKLFEFTPETIGRIPNFLEFLNPYLEISSNLLLKFIDFSHLPLPLVLFLISFCIRMTFLPIVVMQTKKISKFTDKTYFFKEIKKVVENSTLNRSSKTLLFLKLLKKSSKKFHLQPLKLLSMNIMHIPFIIFTIFTLRKTIISENLNSASFLWCENLLQMDPYYILPFVTCAIFYYNFGKGVTPLSKNTFFGRFRNLLQIGMILWFPFLSHWPAAIVFYIMCNAFFSSVQMRFTSSQFFSERISPNLMVSMVIFNKVRNSEKRFLTFLGRFLPYSVEEGLDEEVIFYQAEQEIKNICKDQKSRGIN